MELHLQQLYALMGGDPDGYSALMHCYSLELSRRLAAQPPAATAATGAAASEVGAAPASALPLLGGRGAGGSRQRGAAAGRQQPRVRGGCVWGGGDIIGVLHMPPL